MRCICHRSHPTFVSSCRKHSTNLYSRLCAAHLLLYAQNTYRFHRRGPLVHIYIADAHILFQKYKIYTPRSKPYHTCAACEYHLKKSVIFAVPQNLCRATPCARNSTLLRVRRGKISLRQHRRKKHPALNPVYLRDTLRPLKSFSRSSSNFFCRHFFWLFFALPCRFACASGTRRQNCTRCTKEIRFPPGRSRPVFPAEDKSSVVLLPSTYLICQIKYFLDTFCENFLKYF